ALFYGHVLGQLRRERARADRGFARARELEAKVAERTEQLQRLYEQCLAASRLKSEFIASVSHELRTPLHIMMGYTEMLLDGDGGRTSAERDQMVVRIREASQGLLQLVDGLLDLRKLESGKMPLQIEPFHQVDGGAQRADGVGLGLAIARDYVSLLGGEISVSSKPGVGSSFEVTLPYWPGEPASVTRPAAERQREQRAA